MIHDASNCTYGKVEDVKISAKTPRTNKQNDVQKDRPPFGHKPSYFLDLISAHKHVDWYMTAKEALKHNVANHLRLPHFEVKVSVNIAFV